LNDLAPIVVFVYNRLDHTKQTIKALQKNDLAEKSELYIYSDAAKNEEAQRDVTDVREYLDKIKGFRQVTIIKREVNWGLAKSIIDGVSKVINEHGKIIVLEDDLITAPSFLLFMNSCLEFYQLEDKIFTISGYSNIEVPKTYKENIYFAHISTSWGWATWKDRWESVNWENDSYLPILNDKKLLKDIKKKVGNQRIRMLKQQMNNKINSWAVRRLFTQIISDKMTVFPRNTLVNNIGFDGSGVHCGTLSGNLDKTNPLSTDSLFDSTPYREDSSINQLIFEKNNTTVLSKIKEKLIEIIKLKVYNEN